MKVKLVGQEMLLMGLFGQTGKYQSAGSANARMEKEAYAFIRTCSKLSEFMDTAEKQNSFSLIKGA